MKKLILLLITVLLSACSPKTAIETFADDAKEQIARDYLKRLVDGDTAALIAELDPALPSANALGELNAIKAAIPKEAPTVTNLVGYQSMHAAEGVRYNLTYQFGYGPKWVLASAAWRELPNGKRQIIGLSAHPLLEPLQETNAFSFRHAGARHYVFLAVTIAVPAFILVTLIACIRTNIRRHKWLWVLAILLAPTQFLFNWTSGQVGFLPISVALFGATAKAASIYSPWILSFSIPVGAVLFWVRRRQIVTT